MIRIMTRWYCTLCSHGKPYDPQIEFPPVTCPACSHEGSYTEPRLIQYPDPDLIPVDRAGRPMFNKYGDKLDIEDREQ